MNYDEVRTHVLDAITKLDYLSTRGLISVLEQTGKFRSKSDQQLALECWNDLHRNGVLARGLDFSNPGPEHSHLTAHGRDAIQAGSRDPNNQRGYMAFLRTFMKETSIAWAYLDEGVKAYQAGCNKAAAVMVGGAAESMALELRDAIVQKMQNSNKSVPKGLEQWQIKAVLETISDELEKHEKKMPKELRERFQAHWQSLTGHIRKVRNDAGHPISVNPVSGTDIHGALLMFPSLAQLASELTAWVGGPDYTP